MSNDVPSGAANGFVRAESGQAGAGEEISSTLRISRHHLRQAPPKVVFSQPELTRDAYDKALVTIEA